VLSSASASATAGAAATGVPPRQLAALLRRDGAACSPKLLFHAFLVLFAASRLVQSALTASPLSSDAQRVPLEVFTAL
ncbi:hypothetical protein OFN60_43020, partial [Escherichia coli]|nr:hypothetical protein [Escherichia coli]